MLELALIYPREFHRLLQGTGSPAPINRIQFLVFALKLVCFFTVVMEVAKVNNIEGDFV